MPLVFIGNKDQGVMVNLIREPSRLRQAIVHIDPVAVQYTAGSGDVLIGKECTISFRNAEHGVPAYTVISYR